MIPAWIAAVLSNHALIISYEMMHVRSRAFVPRFPSRTTRSVDRLQGSGFSPVFQYASGALSPAQSHLVF